MWSVTRNTSVRVSFFTLLTALTLINISVKTKLKRYIGKRYKEEKKEHGGDRVSSPHSEDLKRTAQKIAEQSKVGHATVERAEKFAKAVDKVAENTGIDFITRERRGS
jgi:hypothetical protein